MTVQTANTGFPDIPSLAAEGMPIFIEPIAGSSERICVAVAAQTADGDYQVAITLKEQVAKCLLGDQGLRLVQISEFCATHLKGFIEAGGQLKEWEAPMPGVYSGNITQGRVNNLPMMLRTLARNHAFLSNQADFAEPVANLNTTKSIHERILFQVRDLVTEKQPNLKDMFYRSIQLTENSKGTRFDFVGMKSATQLGRIVPSSNISTMVKNAKSKLWDLKALRDMDLDAVAMFKLQQFELMILTPEDTLCGLSDKEAAPLKRAISELEETGDKQNLRVRSIQKPEEAASLILKYEEAA